MNTYLLLPPILFIIFICLCLIISFICSALAYKNSKIVDGRSKPYACGEDITHHRVQPDYKEFFSFAIFFTIMHVVALILTTVPKSSIHTTALTIFYLFCAIISLFILFRRQNENNR